MKQSKLESSIESTANIASGFIISLMVWTFIVQPLYDAGIVHSAVVITTIFTISSWLRSYFWRRFFNAGLHKFVHDMVVRNANTR